MHESTRSVRLLAIGNVVTACLLASGCVQEQRTQTRSRVVIPPTETYEVTERRGDLPDTPLITQTSISNTISVKQLGTIEYDGFTLPIVSRGTDRQYIAAQTGHAPSNDVLLARGGAGTASTEVSIFVCDGESKPELIREHTGGLLLGRSANHEGVLVEKANANGSRWIGLAPWDGGEIRWLLSDDNVNAFGWLHEDATLAYAQRRPEETEFELVVRRNDGSAWRLQEPLPYSWVYPIISPDGESLYALRMGEGFADLAWGGLEDEASFRETLKLHRTSDRVDGMRARQTLASTTGGAGVTTEAIAWFSWDFLRMILWDPRAESIQLLPQGSVAATRGNEDGWLVTLSDKLELAEILTTTTATSLLFPEPWIARPGISDQTIIMLASGNRLQMARLDVGQVEPEQSGGKPGPDNDDAMGGSETPSRTRSDPRRD